MLLEELIAQFQIVGTPLRCSRHGNGHINETYRVECDNGRWYTLQMINSEVFRDPVSLMHNIQAVTAYIAKRVNDPREVLCLIPTIDDRAYIVDEENQYWRMFAYVRDSVCLERVESESQFYESAVAFGRFQNRLADFPAHELFETIPHFHDTPARVNALKQAVKNNPLGRVKDVGREIDFALALEDFSCVFTDLQAGRALPLRVTHNDTKINNVLFDEKTMRGLCVIDLDTVMPGLAMNDFGDAIRFGANTAAEDELDLSLVSLDLKLYDAYVRGYLSTCGKALTQLECELMPTGAKIMTYECGVRFLTDYLLGDHYFHIQRPAHNLDRCRTQFALVADMDRKWARMEALTASAARDALLQK